MSALVGQVINGWVITSDIPYQGLDDAPGIGYHGRFWCRAVTARRGDETTTVRAPEDERTRPAYWPGEYPTVRSLLAAR